MRSLHPACWRVSQADESLSAALSSGLQGRHSQRPARSCGLCEQPAVQVPDIHSQQHTRRQLRVVPASCGLHVSLPDVAFISASADPAASCALESTGTYSKGFEPARPRPDARPHPLRPRLPSLGVHMCSQCPGAAVKLIHQLWQSQLWPHNASIQQTPDACLPCSRHAEESGKIGASS